MSNVFTNDITDTPVLSPGWTVQKGPAGDQSLVSGSGALGMSGGINMNGLLAQSFALEDLGVVTSGGTLLQAGQLQGIKLVVEDPITTTYGAMVVGSAGASSAIAHGWFWLFDSNGNVVLQTADQTSSFLSAASFQKAAWVNGPTLLECGVYFFGAGYSTGTTAPKVVGPTQLGAALNYNLAAVAGAGCFRFWFLGSAVSATGLSGTQVTLTSVQNDGGTSTIQPFAALL